MSASRGSVVNDPSKIAGHPFSRPPACRAVPDDFDGLCRDAQLCPWRARLGESPQQVPEQKDFRPHEADDWIGACSEKTDPQNTKRGGKHQEYEPAGSIAQRPRRSQGCIEVGGWMGHAVEHGQACGSRQARRQAQDGSRPC